MSIKIQSKYNYEEICHELGIDYKEFITLVRNKQNVNEINESKYTLIEVIDLFSTHLEELVRLKKKSNTTLRYYKYFLKRFKIYIIECGSNILISDLNEIIFYSFFKDRNGLSSGTLNTYTAIIRALLSFACDMGYLEKDIRYRFTWNKTKKLPRYIPTDILKKIILLSLQRTHGYRCHAMINFLLGTGCRLAELINIKVKDFNIEDDIIYVIGKGNKERYIPIYPELRKIILSYLSLSGLNKWSKDNNGYLFSKDFGDKRVNKFSHGSVQYLVDSILIKLNLKNQYSVHSFRHSFAVNCLRAGMRLEILSQILGHDDPKSTTIYLQLLPSDLQKEVQQKFPFAFENLIFQILSERSVKNEEFD